MSDLDEGIGRIDEGGDATVGQGTKEGGDMIGSRESRGMRDDRSRLRSTRWSGGSRPILEESRE